MMMRKSFRLPAQHDAVYAGVAALIIFTIPLPMIIESHEAREQPQRAPVTRQRSHLSYVVAGEQDDATLNYCARLIFYAARDA